jgi:hypothetical protein
MMLTAWEGVVSRPHKKKQGKDQVKPPFFPA